MPRQSVSSWVAEQVARHVDLPRLEPIFGCKAFAANTTCDDIHPGGPMPEHSRCCCMICHQTGEHIQRRIDRLFGPVTDAERPRPDRYRYCQGLPGATSAAA
jgi:hypothetical protein